MSESFWIANSSSRPQCTKTLRSEKAVTTPITKLATAPGRTHTALVRNAFVPDARLPGCAPVHDVEPQPLRELELEALQHQRLLPLDLPAADLGPKGAGARLGLACSEHLHKLPASPHHLARAARPYCVEYVRRNRGELAGQLAGRSTLPALCRFRTTHRPPACPAACSELLQIRRGLRHIDVITLNR